MKGELKVMLDKQPDIKDKMMLLERRNHEGKNVLTIAAETDMKEEVKYLLD